MINLSLVAMIGMFLVLTTVFQSLQGFQSTVTTTLSADVTASDTTIPMTSSAGFASTGVLYVEAEQITYTGLESPCVTGSFTGQPSCATGSLRGQINTDADEHDSGELVYNQAAGATNSVAQIQRALAVTNFGSITDLMAFAGAFAGLVKQLVFFDYPVLFSGDFAWIRAFLVAILGIPFAFGMAYKIKQIVNIFS